MNPCEKPTEDLEFKRNGNRHDLTVHRKFFDKIRDGIKTVEGRAGKIDTKNGILENYRTKETSFEVGHTIRFTISGNEESSEGVVCEITKLEFHDSFQEMLAKSGISSCLPGIGSMEEGIRIYRGFSGYAEREKQYGVVGIHLNVLSK